MLVPEPGALGGAKALFPPVMYVVAYAGTGAFDEGLAGQRNTAILSFSTWTFAGSLQSTLNVYSGAMLPCSRYGNSGTRPLQRPWVPLVLPGAGTVPCTQGMNGTWLLFLVMALYGRP